MEEFYQYMGPDHGSASSSFALLKHERLFVYSSPCEKPLNRCSEVRVGSYFACSAVLSYDDQVWLKIRRGYFSNAKKNGYIRVDFDFSMGAQPVDGHDLPPRQETSVVVPDPAPFRYMRRLPAFPTYMCARDRLVLYREPVFTLHSASRSSASSSSATPRPLERFLPPASVFQATECIFNQDFTQLALKVTSSLAGFTGWINASFSQTLIPVEDPRKLGSFRHGPVYMQNVAARGGKWDGALPVRAIPSLEAPRTYTVENYRIVRAIERKLLQDRVWIRIEPLQSPPEMHVTTKRRANPEDVGEHEQETEQHVDQERVGPDAWIIERNAQTAERVMVPWGSFRIRDVPLNDEAERYYRTVYTRRPLPLRRTADLQAEIVGHLEPGSVFSSSHRALNPLGQMWIRVMVQSVEHGLKEGNHDKARDVAPTNNADESKEEEEGVEGRESSVRYGYAILSNAKTNACLVQEIPPPGKMNPKQYYRVVLSSRSTPSQMTSKTQENETADSAPVNTLAARAGAANAAKELFFVKNGAILSAIGTVYNAQEKRMWLQVLASELDPAMQVKHERPLSDVEANLNVVYLPLCDPSSPNVHETVLKPLYREVTRMTNPLRAEKEGVPSPSRIVFTGRASKLFGSHLLRPSTIDLPSTCPTKDTRSEMLRSGLPVATPQAADRAQTLKDEITAWQLQTGTWMSQVYAQLGFVARCTIGCVRKPFTSCLAHHEATRRYETLEQDGEGMEDYALEDDEDHVVVKANVRCS
ncbi:hypothetical protein PsorP6_011031 [Peronosclerospora sorghi]|uniref:Uncharacterized protein n=1 Tax=Peronosclerospora sorghi TaxID=230839 RepID=A0ACC0VXT3_9STRA|nr:hypothetical protein PsorP6_011031 [Peronosclerospora sorghi]